MKISKYVFEFDVVAVDGSERLFERENGAILIYK